ncbi:MAG: FAD-dependent oxidoreductase [Rhodoferax sp.]|nr:FAD-dependent oxidoreductase [Rhodoferax sp.]MCP5263399.1 FAD-dependent oxidoreductase [Rhodoferax sp.]
MNTSPQPYPHLLSPLSVGAHTLRNRVVMGSMHTRMEHLDDAVARHVAFYAERARGGVGLIITGGFSPNEAGRIEAGAPILNSREEALHHHKPVVDAVHADGAKIILQLLHSGRYAKHENIVGVSDIRSPINPRTPKPMTGEEIQGTIDDFVACARLAALAGYDGVEVMGSEGYLINQFVVPRTNNRNDEWGGTFEKRTRFPVELVKSLRTALGPEFMIMYRISALDLVEGGSTADEIDELARRVEAAGADVLNTGYGWHEAPVPTIAYPVPRAAFTFASARIRGAVRIPVIASNRINTAEVAEGILAREEADLISMARPLLADPEFVRKAQEGRPEDTNVCIACNQACLDFIFKEKVATCLVNPRACRETEFPIAVRAREPQRIAVVGAGPAGLSFATQAASMGHQVVLFDAESEVGGQLNLARRVPGKQEFDELLRYFKVRLSRSTVEVRLSTRASLEDLIAGGFDRVVLATGIRPRPIHFPGADRANVVGYIDVLLGRVDVGPRVAIIGTGGIGHDVAELLTSSHSGAESPDEFLSFWGVDSTIAQRGGLLPEHKVSAAREVTLLQRSSGRVGSRLGKSTGWIHRSKLKKRGVRFLSGVSYKHIDDTGFHVTVEGEPRILEVDTIVICAGQESEDSLAGLVQSAGVPVDVIGGALLATELDALRAIDDGMRLAHAISKGRVKEAA